MTDQHTVELSAGGSAQPAHRDEQGRPVQPQTAADGHRAWAAAKHEIRSTCWRRFQDQICMGIKIFDRHRAIEVSASLPFMSIAWWLVGIDRQTDVQATTNLKGCRHANLKGCRHAPIGEIPEFVRSGTGICPAPYETPAISKEVRGIRLNAGLGPGPFERRVGAWPLCRICDGENPMPWSRLFASPARSLVRVRSIPAGAT